MRTLRRKFSAAVEREILARAQDRCEQCGIWIKRRAEGEVDHVEAEGLAAAFRKSRRLTAKDGRYLCKAVCHKAKTRDDVAFIAEAKRREALNVHFGGLPEIARRYR